MKHESVIRPCENLLELFERAARRAAPEGSYRIFLNDDTTGLVKQLIPRLHKGADAQLVGFLNQILAFAGQGMGSHPRSGRPEKPADLVETITPRELEVLQLMAEGLTNAQIARRLYLTVNTLKAHTNSIYGKLDVHSRLQAVNRARALGLLSPDSN